MSPKTPQYPLRLDVRIEQDIRVGRFCIDQAKKTVSQNRQDVREYVCNILENPDSKIMKKLRCAITNLILMEIQAHREDQSLTSEDKVLNLKIHPLLKTRLARQGMTRLNITTVRELIQYSAEELLQTRNFGVFSLTEVRAALSEIELRLRDE